MAEPVGWLERWDRRNQRILEWQQHQYEEERRGKLARPAWKGILAGAVALAALKLLRRPLEDLVGTWGLAGIFWIACGAYLWVAVAGQRRRRRAWEASRRASRSAGAEEVASGPPAAPPTSAGGEAQSSEAAPGVPRL